LEQVTHEATGPADLMVFARFHMERSCAKNVDKRPPWSLRVVAGNPLIMKQMLEHVPDAGSYAPVTILIDERSDGIHLSYDRTSSFRASYGNVQSAESGT
jgi:uncharacterized protein (DUF302 family)